MKSAGKLADKVHRKLHEESEPVIKERLAEINRVLMKAFMVGGG